MKKLLISLLAILALSYCTTKPQFEINITAEEGFEMPDSTSAVAVTYRAKIGETDSTFVFKAPMVNGTAQIKGNVDDIYNAYLYLIENEDAEPSGRPFAQFYLENEKYDITLATEKGALINGGGELQKTNSYIKGEIEKIYDESGFTAILDQLKQDPTNKELRDSLRKLSDEISPKVETIEKDYLNENPTSIYALVQAASNRYYISLDSLKQLVTRFEGVKQMNSGHHFASLKEALAEREALAPGAQAPDFTLDDPDGNPIKLSDFYASNKITMIDFWASWCGPCRAFNPTLTQIYEKYKDKGFGILGVSLDKEKENWIKAIEDDKLVWSHVSDLEYWDCAAAKLYSIKYIPQSYFVDSTGKILLASPEEDEIEKFLEENL